ncbi:type II toxin-antitoxin system SpoIISA family toxin [Sinobaca qinghaiensis]|uniref:type II toxin-antitoxin system SpoIISA family toxin n=1 Tax=Sinobaca qinghaiensis TaxID=342944 RepID=UPI001FE877B4|nr:type II toxin-antitoxin system SpoIISA family toxin [Sinobaca qinghaiensis]
MDFSSLKIALIFMLFYIVFIWSVSSGYTWYYYLIKPWRILFLLSKSSRSVMKEETKKLRRKSIKWYKDNKRKFRRSLYFIFIFCIIIGLYLNLISFEEWLVLLVAAICIVFIDISIFNTPFVNKIGKFEFQHDNEFNEYVEDFRKKQLQWLQKTNECSILIQNSESAYGSISKDLSVEESLRTFLDFYCTSFSINSYVYNLGESYASDKIFEALTNTIDMISKKHTINYEEMVINMENNKTNESDVLENIIETLYDSQFIELERYSVEHYLLIPIYLNETSLIILLKSRVNNIENVDGFHIINLTYLFNAIKMNGI